MDRSAEAESDVLPGQLGQDVAGIRQRPGQPVQLGDHQRIAGAARGEGESQSGPIPVGAGQAMIDVYAVVTDTERPKGLVARSDLAVPLIRARIPPEFIHPSA